MQHLHSNYTFSRDSQGGVSKLSQFGLPGLWEFITLCSNLRLGWGLKKTCSSLQELSNNVSHLTCTHRGQVDSSLLVVGSQIGNLTFGLFFVHNLCCKCPNGSCETIFDIYTSRPFHGYKEHLKTKCFDPCNLTLNFGSPKGLPCPHFRSMNVILTLLQSGVATPWEYGMEITSDMDLIFLYIRLGFVRWGSSFPSICPVIHPIIQVLHPWMKKMMEWEEDDNSWRRQECLHMFMWSCWWVRKSWMDQSGAHSSDTPIRQI
jgi:hypothetical protein